MQLTKYAKIIKRELAMELAKNGSSLEEFEQALASLNTGEGIYKVANEAGKMINDYVGKGINLAGGMPELVLKSSLAGGALAGLTLDEADKSVEELNKSLEREREKVNLVRRITSNLKREHGIL